MNYYSLRSGYAGKAEYPPIWGEDHKEQLCDAGAAELLMPQSDFSDRLERLGVSLATARQMATLYQTSLSAPLTRMVELNPTGCALVMCRYALKPTEMHPDPNQAEARLWIDWCKTNAKWQGGFIPRDDAIAPDSLITQAYTSDTAQIGQETFRWRSQSITCKVEALPLRVNDQPYVAALLKWA